MTFDPETVRAFEHAGWQRAAAKYDATFAHATAPFAEALLDAAARKEGELTCTWARQSLLGLAALELGGRRAPEEER